MLEPFVDATLDALASGRSPSPVALTVLLRVYAATGRDDLERALGASLATAAGASHEHEPLATRAGWLRLYAEAARLSDDPRLRHAAETLASGLQAAAAAATLCADRADAVEAVLAACRAIDARRFAPPAVEELERLVTADYAPGSGLRGRSAGDSVAVALALVAAFEVTGRLAYPMLAEELIRAVRHEVADESLSTCCAAARVLGRLALLHDDEGYRATAVLAPEADYAADSRTLLDRIASRRRTPEEDAAYALALTECGERS